MFSNSNASAPPLHDGRCEEEAICLFGFVPGGIDIDAPSTPALVGASIWAHRVGSVSALASFVPISDYVGVEAQAKLADLEWLAQRTLDHAEVLRWAMIGGTVFPMPFGTLFSRIEGLTAFMVAHEASITRFLSQVDGKEEWGLKARADLDRPETAEAMAEATWPDWSSLTPGVRYMRVRRDHRSLIAMAREKARLTVAALVARFGPEPAEVRALALYGNSDTEGELVANYALLVPKSESSVFQFYLKEKCTEAESHGITISLSGPWPAFSFRPKLMSEEDKVDDDAAFPES